MRPHFILYRTVHQNLSHNFDIIVRTSFEQNFRKIAFPFLMRQHFFRGILSRMSVIILMRSGIDKNCCPVDYFFGEL